MGYIYCIYGVFSVYIQQYTPETEAFFRPRPQAEDEKMPRLRGYSVGYTPKKHRIYNIYPILRAHSYWPMTKTDKLEGLSFFMLHKNTPNI